MSHSLRFVELTTQEMMKKLSATMPKLSRQVNPTAIMPAANCQVAALKASEIQYAMKLVTPHLRRLGGTGSRSLLVLVKKSMSAVFLGQGSEVCITHHLELPSENAERG